MDDEPLDTVELLGAKVTFVPMDSGTPYSLTEWEVHVGSQGPPIHIHHETDEGFYVLEGHFGFVLGGVTTYGFRELAAQLGGVDSQNASIALRKKLSEKYDIEVVGPPTGLPSRG